MTARKPRSSAHRKRWAYLLLRRTASISRINQRMRVWFGQQHEPLSRWTLARIKHVGDLTGDPAFTPKRVCMGRSLTYKHKRLILDELLAECTVSTRELEGTILCPFDL